ncbi:MAG: hypothetical protein QXX55_00705 [Candidatus Pacearchaeota archaeon]
MSWKTYLVMYFSSESKISDVIKRVESIGFKTTFGPVDFIYEWKSKPTKKQVLRLGDNLSKVLKGTGVVFNIDTHESP